MDSAFRMVRNRWLIAGSRAGFSYRKRLHWCVRAVGIPKARRSARQQRDPVLQSRHGCKRSNDWRRLWNPDCSGARCLLTDADLLHGARRGDAEAWRTLYARYLPLVWRQAYALISDVHAAEDIASETMLALLRSIDRLETDEPKIGGWLRTVVRCKAADHQRKLIRARDAIAVTN